MKKIIAAVLASACAVSAMAISASATTLKAVTAAGEVKLTASAGVATPAIDVSVPSTIAAVVNPYGVPVTVNKVTYGAEGLASPLYTIVNRTTTSAVKVTATASVTVPTTVHNTTDDKSVTPNIKVVDSKDGVKSGETDNKAGDKFLYAYVVGSKSVSATIAVEGATPNATKNTSGVITFDPTLLKAQITAPEDGLLEAAENKGEVVKFVDLTATKGTDGQLNNTNVAKPQTLIVLGKATIADTTGKLAVGDKVCYGQFQIGGKVNDDVVWGTADKINVNLILNLTPTADKATGQD